MLNNSLVVLCLLSLDSCMSSALPKMCAPPSTRLFAPCMLVNTWKRIFYSTFKETIQETQSRVPHTIRREAVTRCRCMFGYCRTDRLRATVVTWWNWCSVLCRCETSFSLFLQFRWLFFYFAQNTDTAYLSSVLRILIFHLFSTSPSGLLSLSFCPIEARKTLSTYNVLGSRDNIFKF